jgi:hypothetical protein
MAKLRRSMTWEFKLAPVNGVDVADSSGESDDRGVGSGGLGVEPGRASAGRPGDGAAGESSVRP